MNHCQIDNLFIKNKYTRIYFQIIDKAISESRRKNISVYYERHHILPSCLYPEYEKLSTYKWNGVLLTGREHYICHWLLTKMVEHPQHKISLNHAYANMRITSGNQQRYINSRIYDKLSKIHSDYVKTRLENKNDPFISKKGKENHNYGRRHSEETKQKMSQTRIERGLSKGDKNPMANLTTREKLSATLKENPTFKGRNHSAETKKLISEKNKGKKLGLDNPMHRKEVKNKLSKYRSGKIWITNGITNKLIQPDQEIETGWIRGFLFKGRVSPHKA